MRFNFVFILGVYRFLQKNKKFYKKKIDLKNEDEYDRKQQRDLPFGYLILICKN